MSGLITDGTRVLPLDAPLSPRKSFPIDKRKFFNSKQAAEEAAKSAGEIGNTESQYHYGMKVFVDDEKEGIFAWYTIQRKTNENGETYGELLADDHDGSTVTGIIKGKKDENGQWYTMTYSDGQTVDFCAPIGPKGEDGISLVADGQFYINVDDDGNIILHYYDDNDPNTPPKEPPKVSYNPETGELMLELDGVKKDIGNVKGEKGEKGDQGDKGDKGDQGDKGEDGTDGITPHIDEATGNWFIGETDTGKRANALSIDGQYFLAVEGDQLVCYHDDSVEPPNLRLEADGHLYLYLDESGFVRKDLGKVKGKDGVDGKDGIDGKDGVDGKCVDLPLEKGFNSGYETESIQQVGTNATGWHSFSTGYRTYARQKCARADGWLTSANAESAYAGGRGTRAIAQSQFVIGDFNEENADAAFQIGNGEENARSTLFEVLKDGTVKSGNKTLATKDDIPDVSDFATKDDIPDVSEITANTIKKMFVDGTLGFKMTDDGTVYLITED